VIVARRSGLVLVLALGLLFVAPLWAPAAVAVTPSGRTVVVVLIDRCSFEELLSVPAVRGLASRGGSGLLSSPVPLRDELDRADFGALPVRILDLGSVAGPDGSASPARLRQAGNDLAGALAESGGTVDELAIVATPSPSPAMDRAKDELTGVVVASGPAGELADAAEAGGSPSRTLTSDSTRRSGVVASVDVVPTIDAFLGRPVGDAATIRTDPGPVPLELHRRYLAERRMSVPIQTAAGIWVTVLGLLGVALVAKADRSPARLRRAGALLSIGVLPLGLALLLVGHLPTLSYATVVPTLVVATLIATLAIGWLERQRGLRAAAGIAGVAVLAAFGVEAALGWTAALTPFLGGGELDGGRFYGLPNVDIGLLLGAAAFVAAWLGGAVAGALVIAAVALFAGLPWTGSNLGGAVTMFAAAGIWLGIARSGRLGWREAGFGVVAGGAGLVLTVFVHRYLSTFPTHVTRFAEGESGGFLGRVWDRLGVGVDLIVRNPFALIPVLGVPVCLAVALRPPRPVRAALDREPPWRAAILTILAGSVVAYVANDSGAAALGLGFGTGLGALLAVSLLRGPGMMDA